MSVLETGAHIGILGGGQLGRMLAMAAHPLGLVPHVFDPSPAACAAPLCASHTCAAYDDLAAVQDFARRCHVVTFEIEKISAAALQAVERQVPLRPGADILQRIQDKGRQKTYLRQHGFPTGRFAIVDDAAQVEAMLRTWGQPARLKRTQGGYDGRGQALVAQASQAAQQLASLGGAACILEEELDLAFEISVLVARRPGGQIVTYPLAQNVHRQGILHSSVMPAPDVAAHAEEARRIAADLAATQQLVGLLAVEFFVTRDGALLINELAPRPHNTFHQTLLACGSSQFDNHLRAICDWPLGDTQAHTPVALVNLLGDVWQGGPPKLGRALADARVSFALYGKAPRPGRKMGHLLATGANADDALRNAESAFVRLQD